MKKVVFVEDSINYLELLKRTFEEMPYSNYCSYSKNMKEFTDIVQEEKDNLELVVTDLDIRNENGIDVAIYSRLIIPKAKVLLHTSNDFDLDERIKKGFELQLLNGYLQKTGNMYLLVESVDNYLRCKYFDKCMNVVKFKNPDCAFDSKLCSVFDFYEHGGIDGLVR